MKISKYIKLSIVSFLFIFGLLMKGKAQEHEPVRINAYFQNSSVKDFIDTLRIKYSLNVFYKGEWIENLNITKNFVNTPLIQALNNIFLETSLKFMFFQENGIVIYPKSSDFRNYISSDDQVIIIGDPLNAGRYKKAVLKGRILDGKTGEPLPGAGMYDTRLKKGITTDSEGNFEFEMTTGDHQVQLSFLGFQPSYLKIRLIKDGYEEFEIFKESHKIEEVTIKAQFSDLPRSQMSVLKMNSKDFKKMPALMGETDIIKSMSMLAGVQTVSELSSGFNVRGGNTDQNLLLVSGSPVFNPSHLFGFLSLINPDIVENVRLFKGGIPVKYGERIASVIDVEIKDGNSETVRINGGLGIINSRITFDGPVAKNDKFTFVAGGRSSYTNWILHQIPVPEISQSTTRFYDLSGKLTYKFNTLNKISFTGYISNDEFSTSSESVTRYGNKTFNLNAYNKFSEKLFGELNISYSDYKFRLTDLARQIPSESFHLDNRLKYSSFGYNFRFHPNENHNTDIGFKAVYNFINPGEIVPAETVSDIQRRKIEHEKALEWAAYIGDDYEITPGISLYLGARISGFSNFGTSKVYIYDSAKSIEPENIIDSIYFGKNKISKSYLGLEPRFSLIFDIGPNNSVKMNYQRTRQYLFQLSNNAVISPAETWKAADYYLKPLICDQVAIGYENSSWSKNLDFNVETYFKKLQNLIEYKNGARLIMNEHPETAIIPSQGFSFGIELTAKKETGRLTGIVNYVISRTMRKTNSSIETEKLWNGKYYPSIYDKPHDLSAMGTYNISRRWKLSGNFIYISGRPVTLPELKYPYAGQTLIYYSERNKYRMQPYHRFDLSITLEENLRIRRMWKGSWTLSVYNLYGRKNPYSVYYRKATPGEENGYRLFSLYKLSVIGVPVPSLTYNFKF